MFFNFDAASVSWVVESREERAAASLRSTGAVFSAGCSPVSGSSAVGSSPSRIGGWGSSAMVGNGV